MTRAPSPKTKQTRNPALTRQRILDAATGLFSRQGFDGTSVDAIVEAAGVNKRMVYHYFSDKEGLYVEVLQKVFNRLTDLEIQTFEHAKDPVETIRSILEVYFDFLARNPEFVALLAWENLHHGRFLAANPELLSKSPILERLETTLREGTRTGVFRPGIKVKHLLITLISLCYVYHANRHTLSQSVGLNLSSPRVLKEGLDHGVDMILHGLLAG